jgi:membrane protein DedA with SNARE-associated domain
MLSALINVPAGIGYPLLFAVVAAESAGAFVPGETSLIVAAPWPRRAGSGSHS